MPHPTLWEISMTEIALFLAQHTVYGRKCLPYSVYSTIYSECTGTYEPGTCATALLRQTDRQKGRQVFQHFRVSQTLVTLIDLILTITTIIQNPTYCMYPVNKCIHSCSVKSLLYDI